MQSQSQDQNNQPPSILPPDSVAPTNPQQPVVAPAPITQNTNSQSPAVVTQNTPPVNTQPAVEVKPAVSETKTPETLQPKPETSATSEPPQQSLAQPSIVRPTVNANNEIEAGNSIAEPGASGDSAEQQQSAEMKTDTANQAITEPTIEVSKSLLNAVVYLQLFTLFMVLVAFLPAPLFFNTFAMVSGVLMMGLGLFLGAWAFLSFRQKITISPKPLRHSFLVTGGPYKYMRHPMYGAILLAATGLTFVYPTVPRITALLALVVVIYYKISIEEYLLAERYHHYARYQRITGKILPKFKKPDVDVDFFKFER